MASAVLASRNEPSWGHSGGGFMGKLPFNNLNPNPNSRPIPKKKQSLAVEGRHVEDSPAVTQTVSDDAYSFNQRPLDSNGCADFNYGGYVSFNISSYTRSELVELKRRLMAELEQIRSLKDNIQSGNFQPRSQGDGHQFHGKGKNVSGKKRPLPFVSGKDLKRVSEVPASGLAANEIGDLMKMCRQSLTTLMKIKRSWIFKQPVDAAALGLHDYHQIVKHPMDLGTVKSKFAKNLYASPLGFAADVRLTFNNAILYNPRTDDVHHWAEELLGRFEELFRPIEERLGSHRREQQPMAASDEFKLGSWNHIPTPEIDRTKKSKSSVMATAKKNENVQTPITASKPSLTSQPLAPSPPITSSPAAAPPVKPAVVRPNIAKQLKPKAKDPDKREMSMEEKQKLGLGLQSLPQEKMPQLIQIVRKRNEHLAEEGDEIELDFGALDTETLWELDRFVVNWKKMVSKTKRQALMVNNSNPAAGMVTTTTSASVSAEDNAVSASEKMETAAKKPKKGDAGEEDVDIGDEMPMSSFPPVEIEKDDGVAEHGHAATSSSSSSSGSSSSDSSSSSDTDSASSSGSDSDAQMMHGHGVLVPRNFQRLEK